MAISAARVKPIIDHLQQDRLAPDMAAFSDRKHFTVCSVGAGIPTQVTAEGVSRFTFHVSRKAPVLESVRYVPGSVPSHPGAPPPRYTGF